MTPLTPTQLLRLAAARLGPETWCQGSWVNDEGQCCAAGHLMKAASHLGVDDGTLDEAESAAEAAVGDGVHAYSLELWNDTQGRTWTDVRDLFLRVADQLEQEAK